MAEIEAHRSLQSSGARHFLSHLEPRRGTDLKALAEIADELSVAKGIQAMAEGDPKDGTCCGFRGLVHASSLCHFEVELLPALPSSVTRLGGLLDSAVIDLRELVRTVWSDPSIAAQVLHRAMFEKRGELPTRIESVLLVGVQGLTELVMGTPVVLPTNSGFASMGALVRHARVVSLLSERFALARGGCSADHAAILGLLHHSKEIRDHYASTKQSSSCDRLPLGTAECKCDSCRADEDASDRKLLQILKAADYVANIIGVGLESDEIRCGTYRCANLFSGNSRSGPFPSGHTNNLERENIWAFVH